MGTQESVDDIITDFKFNSILSELQDLKAMVTELYNARHHGKASANATLSAAASDVRTEEETQRSSYFRQLINDPARLTEIYNAANDTVKTRNPHLTRQNLAAAVTSNGQKCDGRKEAILAMCKPWLLKNMNYNPIDSLTQEEVEMRVEEDLDRRYQATYQLISLFVQTRFSNEGSNFRWTDLSKRQRDEMVYLVEHLLENLLGVEDFLPLSLAPKGWAASYLISILIRNQAKAKSATTVVHAISTSTAMTASSQATDAASSPLSNNGFSIPLLVGDEESVMIPQVSINGIVHSDESSPPSEDTTAAVINSGSKRHADDEENSPRRVKRNKGGRGRGKAN
ncbi:hypothetical protein [Parasitella parasitica]|uniref:Uncharacterized protein n=1 Tax=Parasitella parasitica TaxID=35722 RepID=A0A0B7NU05_9FUNG|nr:hypothetical protein [Parasitella parasitica]